MVRIGAERAKDSWNNHYALIEYTIAKDIYIHTNGNIYPHLSSQVITVNEWVRSLSGP